jgi:hypothetical protein
MNYNTEYTKFADQTFYWLSMDSEELYKKHLTERYEDLKKNGWINSQITYKFNSHGFRSEEFTSDPSVMFLGCSFTCGIGMPYEKIWPTLVANRLNMRSANLGVGGTSPDTAFRMCHGYIDKIKPKLVIFLVSPGIRVEYYSRVSNHPLDLSPANQHHFYKLWIENELNYTIQKERNITAIKGLCLERNIKFVVYNSEDINRNMIVDHARDLAHFGVKSHANIANTILSLI